MEQSERFELLQQRLKIIEENIETACKKAGRSCDEITLVGVTKTVSPEVALDLYQLGIQDLGESRPQELWRKAEELPKTIRWHQIGHLQTNKIERTLPLVTFIHSVDSFRLLQALEKEARKQEKILDVFLEINASGEENKHGLSPQEASQIPEKVNPLQWIRVRGLMTMAAFEEDPENCRPTFSLLRKLSQELSASLSPPHSMTDLSMGMSNDYPIAIEEGATLIRLGSTIFEGL